ncbi:alpha-glucosidase/alpha-galactosidase [Cohnella zeiphila]|uniref:Alpha-glucosidase/alpha-galactosidase n=1 Tax=Cohnella zeiphila TaxID=2761120 RepID=A0A7X0SIR7_9BACL|nr:alpha-glucosidase/alpha-galactosidase [Cohnella zeiphila]MBB6729450.1 alpha-glucosidase/alpha-galactosidase [Cohnella zeiphila]
MRFEGEKATDIRIAYIGGGSKGWAWGLMSDLAAEPKLSGTVKLYDIDYQAAANNAAIGNRLNGREDVSARWTYEAAGSLQAALTGADFVIISILPGTFAEMESDVHLPEEYGIYQTVGDTVGPGGLMRALRTIPMYVEIAEGIERFAPDAWVINFTNPMTLCVRTLYEVFPKIKAIGCCHEVFGTQNLLVDMLKDLKGLEGIARRDIQVNVLGINHFTWIDQASCRGMDLIPLYREFAEKYGEIGFEREPGRWAESPFRSANRIHFDLFKRYHVIAAAGDRHLAEFMPGTWYLKDPETIRSWKIGITPVSLRVQKGENLLRRSERLTNGEEEFPLKKTGEDTVSILKALVGLESLVTNVNMPNAGQIGGIPAGAVVETNASFRADSVRPVQAGELSPDIHALVLRHVMNQETVLRAALTRDKRLALAAFLNDPLVTIAPGEAEALFHRMLNHTRAYLPGWEL